MVSLPIVGSHDSYEIHPTKIIALGLNYREHIAESTSVKAQNRSTDDPVEPVLFPKTPNVLIATGEEIVIPAFLLDYKFDEPRVDYEGELAFVVRDECKNVAAEEAYDHILGFTCMNDVSQRNLQHGDRSGWFRGKSLDTFGPVGPVLVPMEAIGDPQNLSIETRLNGKVVQKANTKQMIFSIREMFAFISRNFTLFPGDLVTTGTPAGVGKISHGDVVDVEIENIGVLSNPVVEESRRNS